MNRSVTSTAKRLEIFQRIVPFLFRCSNAKPVSVVNVQVILTAAALAGVIVTLQSSYAISAETIVVFGLLAILLYLVWVLGGPLAQPRDLSVIPAGLAFSLRASRILKRRSAIFARQHVTFARRSNGIFFGPAVFGVFDAAILFLASVANLLRRACGLVVISAHAALLAGKTNLGFTMCGKGAGRASLFVRACSCYLRAAVRAFNNAVGFHMSRSRMIPNKYSGGAV
jgi:hypothetical protein